MSRYLTWTGLVGITSLLLVGLHGAYAASTASHTIVRSPLLLSQSQQHGSLTKPEFALQPSSSTTTTARFDVPKVHSYMVQVAASETIKNVTRGRCASPHQGGKPGLDLVLDGHENGDLSRDIPQRVPGEPHTVANSYTLPVTSGRHVFRVVIGPNVCRSGVTPGRFKASHAQLAVTLLADYRR
jgi:hypothetical protein